MDQRPIIGVIEPDLVGAFTAAVMDGIYNITQQNNIQVIVCKGSPMTIGKPHISQNHVAGWILCDTQPDIQYLGHPKVPVVAISMAGCAELIPTIMPDNWGGIKAVMQHLFEHGHEKIAFIGTMKNADVAQRYHSYRAALEEQGITYDDRLVVDTVSFFEEHGRAATQSLLETGLPFTAIVTAGDFNAFGAMELLRAAGKRVPEDVVVTGFDDVPSALFADPPLTTVYQRPEALGELAATTLMTMIGGKRLPPGEVFAPTALIRRRSCGCDISQVLPPPDTNALRERDWQKYLIKQMVMLARHPLPLDPSIPPSQIWPRAAALTEHMASLLQGSGGGPNTKLIEQAWRDAVVLTNKLDILHAMVKLLEIACQEQLAIREVTQTTRAQLSRYLDLNRLAMMRAQRYHDEVFTDELDQLARTYAAIDTALLGNQEIHGGSFAWMEQTLVDWACLGLWEDPDDKTTLKIASLYQRQPQTDVEAGSIWPAAAFPPADLLRSTPSTNQPTNVVMLPVDTTAAVRPYIETRSWGVLALNLPSAKQIIYDLHGLKLLASRLAAKLERQILLRSLHEQKETLIEAKEQMTLAYQRELALTSTIRELGCPIIPLLEGVLLVPLIGGIDSIRAQQILGTVLEGIQQYRAEIILIDVTGVPLVDTEVANSLIQTARAAKLLGTRTVMVGVRPEIAQSIVGLGIDLRLIETFPSLAAALNAIMIFTH